jgi:two-component system, NarL family, sensor kinase
VSAEEDALRAEVEALRFEVEALRGELESSRQLVNQVMDADERGRREIAQRIHDETLQSLLAAHQELLEAAPGRAQVTRAHEVVANAIDRLREAVAALHPVTLEQAGLGQALSAASREAERLGGFRCELEVDQEAAGEHAGLLLSVARELLANAAKHSDAEVVRVSVSRDGEGGGAVLEVADNGTGIPPGRREAALRQGHVGLASVSQRLESVGGSLELAGGPGEGTRALARVPAA